MTVLTQMPEEGTQVFWPEFGSGGDESDVASVEVGYYPTMLPQLLENGMLHDSHDSAARQAAQIKLMCGDKTAVPALLYPTDSYINDVLGEIVSTVDWAHFKGLKDCVWKVTDKEDETETWTLDKEVVMRGLRMMVDGRYNVDNSEMIQSLADEDASYIDQTMADNILQYGLFGEIVYN